MRIPPPILFLLSAIIIYFLPTTIYSSLIFRLVASLLCISAFVIAVLSLWAFKQAKTTINPRDIEQVSTLITTGIFRVSRNPMYLSLALWLFAWGIFCETLWSLVVVIGFIGYITECQIKPEEKVLTQKFSTAYLSYKQSVRRWI